MLVTGLYWRQLYVYLAAERRKARKRRPVPKAMKPAARLLPMVLSGPGSRTAYPGSTA
jgi:hypothetical protein